MIAVFTEALAAGEQGWLEDDLAMVRPRGVDLAALGAVQVSIWQGAADRMVPHGPGRWLVGTIPGARAHLFPQEGHLSLAATQMRQIPEEVLGAA